MPLRSPQRKRKMLSMTSLIDVIFLLLLFFMLSSTFTKFAEVQLSSGGAGDRSSGGDPTEPPVLLRLGAEDIRVNGKLVELSGLAPHLRGLARGGEGVTPLLIDPSNDEVTSQRLVDVLVAVDGLPKFDARVLE